MTRQEQRQKLEAAIKRVVAGEGIVQVAVEVGYDPAYLAQSVRKYRARRGRPKPKNKGAKA